ncbi:hypothetical protein [Aeromonas bivalvium]|uniref:hypothetical protein n=1 Tax=Aeromonas bivalvium TaxID=440079 RepID=UPI0038D03B8E
MILDSKYENRFGIDCLFRKGESNILLCLLPSAQNSNSDIRDEFYSRWSWHDDFKSYHILNISDPALKKARLAGTWFLDESADHIKNISSLVSEILFENKIEKVIFYGSSMGGFGALMCAAETENSYAVAEIPQLDLRKYAFRNAIAAIENSNLINGSIDDLYNIAPEKVSVVSRFSKSKCVPNALIITNYSDHEFGQHMSLLPDALRADSDITKVGHTSYEVFSNVVGHSTIDLKSLKEIIKTVADRDFSLRVRELGNSSSLDYKAVLDEAIELSKKVRYVRDKADSEVYANCISLLKLANKLNPKADWPLLKACSMIKLWNNSYTLELLECAQRAFDIRESVEAFIYLCRGIITHKTLDQAYFEISDICCNSVSNNINSLGKVFLAIVSYENGKYSEYESLINDFNNSSYEGEKPYIAIPTSTVFTEDLVCDNYILQNVYDGHPIKCDFIDGEWKYIVSTSVDMKYFLRYGEYIVRSFSMTCADDASMHISVLNGDIDVISQKLKEWGGRSISVSIQEIDTKENIGPIASLLRFSHIYELINRFKIPVVVLDFDCVIKKSFTDLVLRSEYDVASRVLGQNVAPWEKYTGGFAIFNYTESSVDVAKNIALAAETLVKTNKCQWWIDQNCFEAGIRMAKKNNVKVNIENIYNIRDQYCVMPVGNGDSKLHVLTNALNALNALK